jgi:MFS family permease
VAYFVGSLLVPRLAARYGRAVLTTGMVLQAIGLALLFAAVVPEWPHVRLIDLAPGLIVAGLGQSLGVGGIFRLVLSNVPQTLAGVGSGVLIAVQQGSMAIGVASLGTLFAVRAEHGFGPAFGLVIGIQIAITVVIAVAARRLPHPAN